MAATAAGERLTERHRLAQLRIRARFLREFMRMWPLLDMDRLDETTAEWINIVSGLIADWRAESAQRALAYYEAFRRAELPVARPDAIEPAFDPARYLGLAVPSMPQIRTSLLVTGPIGYRSRIAKGFTPTMARTTTFTAVSGAASRHVLDGGRRQLIGTANADEMAVGFSRVTDGDPCSFCAMAASRGPVYKSRATASLTTERSKRGPGEQYHDNCGCTAEPSFSRDTDWPSRNRGFEQLWKDSTAGLSGKHALNAFRRALKSSG
jgi:hypothetical protein